MADTLELNSIASSGKWSELAAKLNENFDLVKVAILAKLDGKSAFQLWQEYMEDDTLTEDDFWAFLTADKGYSKVAVASQSALPSLATADANTLYVYPNDAHTEYYTVIVNSGRTGWITLLTNDGDITDLENRISQIEQNIGSTIWEDIAFTTSNGLISSETGEIVADDNYRNTEIDLTDTTYTKIRFQSRVYSTARGYGFVVNGVWQGVQGSSNEIIDVTIPDGATAFRTCWYKTQAQNIQGFKSQLVTDDLRALIATNAASIEELSSNINELYEKLGSETFVGITYTEQESRCVNSITGDLVEIEGYNAVEIALDGTYSKIKFKSWAFSGNYGYGFIVDGEWQGVKGTTKQEITIDVPENATMFKTCWSTQTDWYTQDIQGATYQDVFVDLQEQINDNINSITSLQNRISEIIAKMGTEEYVSVEFTQSVGLVSSDDGTIKNTDEAVDYRYTEIDLTNTTYTKIKFLSRKYGSRWGYGFVVNGAWQGTRGTINGTIEVDIPEGATAFRCCWYNTQTQAIYGLAYVDSFTSLQQQIENLQTEIESVDPTSFILKPFSISVPDCDSIIPNLTVSSLYALWDALVSEYPDYITSTELGYDQSGTYKLREIDFGIANMTTKKVMVIANIHGSGGDSHIPSYIMYWLTKYVLDNKSTDELAQWILSNFYFVIIPIANPWGYMNDSRGNSRNIDLNRNFDADFVPNADPYNTGITGGDTAASEAETQLIQGVMDANTDMWMYVDFHSQPEPKPSVVYKRDRMQLLPNSADTNLVAQCQKILHYGKFVANDWIENIPTSTGGQSMRYAYKQCGVTRAITPEAAASHPDEHIDNSHYESYKTKAMTGAARLFLSLLRFEN